MNINFVTIPHPDLQQVCGLIKRAIKGFQPLNNDELQVYRSYMKSQACTFNLQAIISIRDNTMINETIKACRTNIPKLQTITKATLQQHKHIPPLCIIAKNPHVKLSRNVQTYALLTQGFNPIYQKMVLDNSIKYEALIVNYFRKYIQLQTELDLRKSGSSTTPDMLFDEPQIIVVNGVDHLLNWIDVKNYFYFGPGFMRKKLISQAERYTAAHGSGAFLFRYGYVPDEKIQASGVLFIDGSALEKLI